MVRFKLSHDIALNSLGPLECMLADGSRKSAGSLTGMQGVESANYESLSGFSSIEMRLLAA